jgi:proline-specific peptidase
MTQLDLLTELDLQSVRQGYLPVPGGMVRFWRVGTGGGTPLLVLHGGPGFGSDYLATLVGLAADRPVVFYDQLGGGRSEIPADEELWRLDRFVAELAAVRLLLGLSRVHLFGHSWGGWLAIEYLLTNPAGVCSVTLASTSASVPEYLAGVATLRAELPGDLASALAVHEAREDYDAPQYRAALIEFSQRHLCRLPRWPPELERLMLADSPVYRVMSGPNEMVVTGSLRTWDRTADLAAIGQPALVTVGRHDEMVPGCAETLRRGLPNARLQIFGDSAHMPHLEQTDDYLAGLAVFLAERDADPATVRNG